MTNECGVEGAGSPADTRDRAALWDHPWGARWWTTINLGLQPRDDEHPQETARRLHSVLRAEAERLGIDLGGGEFVDHPEDEDLFWVVDELHTLWAVDGQDASPAELSAVIEAMYDWADVARVIVRFTHLGGTRNGPLPRKRLKS